MLKYENINLVKDAEQRMKYDRYRWGHNSHSRDSDTLLVFTQGTQAEADAKSNLDFCLDVGRKFNADYLVLHEDAIQFVGKNIREGVLDFLMPADWSKKYMEWADTRNIHVSNSSSGLGEVYSFNPWRRAFADTKTRGIYKVDTGTRIKNRRQIIEAFWSFGFATQRGRTLSVSSIRYSGSRDELEELTQQANKYWNRRFSSDVAKKIVSAYRSINRYAAWPGAW